MPTRRMLLLAALTAAGCSSPADDRSFAPRGTPMLVVDPKGKLVRILPADRRDEGTQGDRPRIICIKPIRDNLRPSK